MTAAAVELHDRTLPVTPGSVCDDLSLRIVRAPRGAGKAVPEHEARWVECCRRLCTAKLQLWDMHELVENAQLLTSELVTNALQHGDGSSDIVVRFVITADRAVIVVDDDSPGAARVRQAEADDEVGRGMLLVSALATQWGVSPSGATTWCVLVAEARV